MNWIVWPFVAGYLVSAFLLVRAALRAAAAHERELDEAMYGVDEDEEDETWTG